MVMSSCRVGRYVYLRSCQFET
uniref:Uncharacterized protein n=1 Tax=Lepeophtheirus salmonis TaxID=72036 RepID=A0A0K2V325_LEPSM